MKKPKTKVTLKRIAIMLVLAGIVVLAYATFIVGEKRGFLAGEQNVVICQAALQNKALQPLCK